MSVKRMSSQEILGKVAEVDRYRGEGLNYSEAAKKAGISVSMYYHRRKSPAPKAGPDSGTGKIVAEVRRLNAEGMSIQAACKKLGVHHTTYYNYLKRAGGKTPAATPKARKLQQTKITSPAPLTMPYADDEGDMLIIKGDRGDVIQALQLLERLGRR